MMGVLPLQFMAGETPETLGLTGRETFSILGVENGEAREVTVRADGTEFRARVRLDTPREREYFRHGGILPYVLRRLLAAPASGSPCSSSSRARPARARRRSPRRSATGSACRSIAKDTIKETLASQLGAHGARRHRTSSASRSSS